MPEKPSNRGKGYIGKNRFKKTDNQPDIVGKLTIDGTEFSVAGWRKEDEAGGFYSLSISEPYKKDSDDDVPF